MSQSDRQCSIVEYFGVQKDYRCGYCKLPDNNHSHGMWAHFLTPRDYQDLINRGWRRSGKYVYKPTNNVICCPAYTISCRALEFQLSKSQKKVLKRFSQYLDGEEKNAGVKSTSEESNCKTEGGESKKGEAPSACDASGGSENISSFVPLDGKMPMDVNEIQMSSEECDATMHDGNVLVKPLSGSSESGSRRMTSDTKLEKEVAESETNVDGNSFSSRKPMQKAKAMRIERKKQKLLAKGIDPNSVLLSKKPATTTKMLEDFMIYPDTKKKFLVKTVKVGSKEFKATFDVEVNLYKRYQMTIHNDDEDDCTASQFKRFLCDSPLTEEEDQEHIYGTYHQQYYIDGELMAVGVIDILPECVSSVYFFYSPDCMQLSPGSFGALKEIAFTRELHKSYPSIQYYYLGFYIHSCTKMRYKGSFSPSYLLCPEEFTWHLLNDDLRNRLSANKYSRLSPNPSASAEKVDIRSIPILHKRRRLKYEVYCQSSSSNDNPEVQEYADLIGKVCAKSIVLYRH